MSAVVIDIETVPLASSMEAPYPEAERNPPGNYKNPDAIERWREADKIAWAQSRAKECSLNPRLGRVLCLGYDEGTGPCTEVAATEYFEREALELFWQLMGDSAGKVVTWNGDFDLRFLLVRSMAHKIKPSIPANTVREWFRRYVVAPHFDCKSVLMNWDNRAAGEGLDEWCQFFGIAGKLPGTSGADVYPMYLAGQFDEIADYCQQDVTATTEVYHTIAPYFDHHYTGRPRPIQEVAA